MARFVTSCFPIDVTTKLTPRTGCVLVDAHVARERCSAIIVRSSDRDPVTTRIHRYRKARFVISCFPIDVRAELLSDPIQGSGVIRLTGGCSVACQIINTVGHWRHGQCLIAKNHIGRKIDTKGIDVAAN